MSHKAGELSEQLTRLVWLFHRYYHKNHMQYGPMGDTQRGQGRILAFLKMHPEISQKDLSHILDMQPQSLGEFLFKLEKNGYITRTPSETDRRVMNIKLTQEGREANEPEINYDKMFDCLSEEEQMRLSEYFSRIIETFISELGGEKPGQDFGPEDLLADHFHEDPHRRSRRKFRRK